MIYEMRTYIVKPTTVPEFEARFGERCPIARSIPNWEASGIRSLGP